LLDGLWFVNSFVPKKEINKLIKVYKKKVAMNRYGRCRIVQRCTLRRSGSCRSQPVAPSCRHADASDEGAQLACSSFVGAEDFKPLDAHFEEYA
jgi:hypothetical protein